MQVPFLKPEISESDIKAAAKVLRSGWITRGPTSVEFEEKFASYFGKGKHTITMNSGTAPMHVALMAAGVGPGDEVIVPAISYVATANVVLYVGAIPVFADVDPKTGLMSINNFEKLITKKTKAVIPVHLYGQMMDMKKITSIAKKRNIIVIEDACHAIEASRDGIRSGDLSFAASFSFHAAKNITAGEGGALVVNDHTLAEKCHILADSGVQKDSTSRRAVALGYKYSFTSFQCALLIGQLKRIDKSWKKRKVLYERYEKAFSGIAGISFPQRDIKQKHGHHMFPIFIDPEKRDAVRDRLRQKGVQTAIHYDPIPLEPYYVKKFGFTAGDFPHAERLGGGEITLPLYPSLSKKEQEYVIQQVIIALS